MNSKLTITNECETKPIVRRYYPRFESRFRFERNLFDFAPEVNEWVQQVLECSQISEKRFNAIKDVTLYVAHFYPFCNDIDRYNALIKTFLLWFVFDDHSESDWGDVSRDYEKALVIWGQYSRALDKMMSPESFVSMIDWKPYSLQTFAVVETVCHELNGEQKRRLAKYWKVYCEGSIDECKARSKGCESLTETDKYSIRSKSASIEMSLQLIEYADNVCLSDAEWNDPLIRDLVENANHCVMYVNDMYSFEKEYKEQHYDLGNMFNNVAHVAVANNCSIDEAMDAIIAKNIECENNVFELINTILEDKNMSEDVKTFVTHIEYLIGGNWKVESLLDRYNII